MRLKKIIAGMTVVSIMAQMTIMSFATEKIEVKMGQAQTGEVSLDIKFDNNENYDEILDRNIVATIGGIGSIYLNESPLFVGGYPVQIEPIMKEVGNDEMTGEKILADTLSALRIKVSNLPIDDYSILLTGDRHANYQADFSLNEASQHIVVYTGNKGFTYGDVTGDKVVDDADVQAVAMAIDGQENAQNTGLYDLNNDGEVTIMDLAIVKTNKEVGTETTYQNTTLTNPESLVKDTDVEVFDDGTMVVSFDFTSETDENGVEIYPEISEMQINTSQIKGGTAIIEYVEYTTISELVDGETVERLEAQDKEMTVNLLVEEQTDTQAIALGITTRLMTYTQEEVEETVVVISLGSRVAVKKITVNVEEVDGEIEVVKDVTFIVDIVPEDPYKNDGIVKLYSDDIKTDDKSLSLTWDPVANVGGYKISWGTSSGKYTSSMYVSSAQATITGLENLTPYYIMVQSTYDSWVSGESNEVIGIPQPKSLPGAPRNIIITEEDEGATFNWSDAKDGETYNLYIGESATNLSLYAKGISSLTYTIRGLENDKTYYMQLSASNVVGEGPKTDVEEFVPERYEVTGPELPTYNRVPDSNIKSITLADSSNIDSTWTTPNFTADYLIDGDYSTSWVARNYGYESGFIVEFNEPVTMDYMLAVEKLDRDGYYISKTGNYNIKVWSEDYPTGKQIVGVRGSSTNRSVTRISKEDDTMYMLFTFPEVENITKIQFGSRIYDGANGMQSFSEVAFYEADDIEERVDALFTNSLQSELVSTVTLEQIDEIEEEFSQLEDFAHKQSTVIDDLNKAKLLLAGDDSMVGYIKDDFMVTSNGFLPLGVVGLGNFDMRIMVDGLQEGDTLEFGYSQFYDETGVGTYESAVTVTNGENYITVPDTIAISSAMKGGAMYYKFTGSSPETVKVHFYRMIGLSSNVDYTSKIIHMPTLELSDIDDLQANEALVKERMTKYVTHLNEYQTMNYTELSVNETEKEYVFETRTNISYSQTINPVNSTEISYKQVLHSIPATQAYIGLGSGSKTIEKQVEQLYESALAWDELLSLLNYAYGIDEDETSPRQHNKYMRQTSSSSAYAAGSHIGVGYDWTSAVTGGQSSYTAEKSSDINVFGWGYAHEFGHNMDRVGDAESSNNLYSALSVTWDGNLGQGTGSRVNYEGVYDLVSLEQKSLPTNFFIKLGMYWQLHLAYSIDGPDDVDSNPLDFYHNMNSYMRNGATLPIAASKSAGKDLTNFFEAWGYNLSETEKTQMSAYPAETRNIEYLNDSARNYRIAGGTGVTVANPTFAVDAEIEDKTVTLTISDNIDDSEIIGYKISRDGKGIGFVKTQSNGVYTYSDTINSINNVSFEYQVQPIDMLGNFIGEQAHSQSVRIEYNDTIDKSEFVVEKTAEGYKFTVANGRTVSTSGILINSNVPTNGEFEIVVGSALEDATETMTLAIEVTDENGVTSIEEYEVSSDVYTGEDEYAVDTDVESNISTDESDEQYIAPLLTYTTAKQGDLSINDTNKDGQFINYFNKPNVAPSDTRIAVYDAYEIIVIGLDEYIDDIEFIRYVGDNVAFEEYKMGKLTHDFDTGAGVLKTGDVIVVGNYIGDPYFNEIYLEGKYSTGSTLEDSYDYTTRAIAGDTYMFAEVPEGGAVTTISDGLFIFKMNEEQESNVQGSYISCSHLNLYPEQFRAVMTLNDSTGASRTTSYTSWEYTPDETAMPSIVIQ